MREPPKSFWQRFKNQILPETPDFYRCLSAQCDGVVSALDELVRYMQTGLDEHAERVRQIVHAGDELKSDNMRLLHESFSTPMDREDINQAIAAIDDILTYAKNTVKEMQVLGLKPDEHTLAMAQLQQQGAVALQGGFRVLKESPIDAEQYAYAVRKTEHAVENAYRKALVELFDAKHYKITQTGEQQQDAHAVGVLLAPLDASENTAVSSAVGFVVEILKRREIYRHMSNTSDRLVRAGEVLYDIVVKVA